MVLRTMKGLGACPLMSLCRSLQPERIKMMKMKHHFKNSIMYLSDASVGFDICETYSSKSPGQGHHWHFLQNRKHWLISFHALLEPTGFLSLTLLSNS